VLGRKVVTDNWISKQANDEGWILWAMDWRGFSIFDIPEIGRMVMSDLTSGAMTLEAAITQVSSPACDYF
jgi:hypothetical protein